MLTPFVAATSFSTRVIAIHTRAASPSNPGRIQSRPHLAQPLTPPPILYVEIPI